MNHNPEHRVLALLQGDCSPSYTLCLILKGTVHTRMCKKMWKSEKLTAKLCRFLLNNRGSSGRVKKKKFNDHVSRCAKHVIKVDQENCLFDRGSYPTQKKKAIVAIMFFFKTSNKLQLLFCSAV